MQRWHRWFVERIRKLRRGRSRSIPSSSVGVRAVAAYHPERRRYDTYLEFEAGSVSDGLSTFWITEHEHRSGAKRAKKHPGLKYEPTLTSHMIDGRGYFTIMLSINTLHGSDEIPHLLTTTQIDRARRRPVSRIEID